MTSTHIYGREAIFYVYAYLRSETSPNGKAGTPYYIGKGKGIRAYSKHHGKINLPRNKSNIIIMETNLTELGAFALERRMIQWWGRKNNGSGCLMNLTDGGEGQKGAVVSQETRRKQSDSHKAYRANQSPEDRKEETRIRTEARKKRTPAQKASTAKIISDNAKRFCANKTEEQWKEQHRKSKETIDAKTHEEKEATTLKMSNSVKAAQARMTDEEKEQAFRKISLGHAKRTPEQKAETARKLIATLNARSPEEKAAIKQKAKEKRDARTPEQKEAESRNKSAAAVKRRRLVKNVAS